MYLSRRGAECSGKQSRPRAHRQAARGNLHKQRLIPKTIAKKSPMLSCRVHSARVLAAAHRRPPALRGRMRRAANIAALWGVSVEAALGEERGDLKYSSRGERPWGGGEETGAGADAVGEGARGTDGGGATGSIGIASPGLHPAGMGIGSPGFQSSGMIGMGGVVMPPASAAMSAAASVVAAARALAFAVAASWALQHRGRSLWRLYGVAKLTQSRGSQKDKGLRAREACCSGFWAVVDRDT